MNIKKASASFHMVLQDVNPLCEYQIVNTMLLPALTQQKALNCVGTILQ